MYGLWQLAEGYLMSSEKRPYQSPSMTIVQTLGRPVAPPPTWGWDCHGCGAFMRGLDSDQQARESSERHRREAHGDPTENGPSTQENSNA